MPFKFNPFTHKLDIVEEGGGGGGITTVNGDNGSVTGSIISLLATPNAGSSVVFDGSGTTMNLEVTDARSNTFIGNIAGNKTLTGSANTSLGANENLGLLTSATANTAIGQASCVRLTSGGFNTFVGSTTAQNIVTGARNTGIGYQALTTANSSASDNISVGYVSSNSFTGTESNNIMIGSTGVAGDNHKIRIGATGSGTRQQNQCFIAGIAGTSGTGNIPQVSSTGQILDSGIKINSNSGGGSNVMIAGGNDSVSGTGNSLQGFNCAPTLSSGANNCGLGSNAGFEISSGSNNTFLGPYTGYEPDNGTGLTSGGQNLLAGIFAGSNYTGAESGNTLINSSGVVGESNAIHIGDQSRGGLTTATSCFIGGISGVSVTGNPVVVDAATGQLGVGSAASTPAFNATLSADINNVTGDGTNYLVVFDTETFDTTASFNPATGIFTAPSTGTYQFSGCISINGVVTTSAIINLITSQSTYFGQTLGASTFNSNALSFSALVPMSVGEVAGLALQASGGVLGVGVNGGASPFPSWFMGYKVA